MKIDIKPGDLVQHHWVDSNSAPWLHLWYDLKLVTWVFADDVCLCLAVRKERKAAASALLMYNGVVGWCQARYLKRVK